MMNFELSDLVNLDRYPINRPDSDSYLSLVEKTKKALKMSGIVVLDGFSQNQLVNEVKEFAYQNLDNVYVENTNGNVYLNHGDSSFSDDHPLNIKMESKVGVLSYQQIPEECRLRQLYHNEFLKTFIQDVVDRGDIYHYECDLGSINIASMKKTEKLRWHFDLSDFVVSIPIQDCEEGGEYQYVYHIRDGLDENYADVKKLLDGDETGVQTLDANPGSLVLFEGKYTIHRVTEIKGDKLRIVGLLGFATEPGVKSNAFLRKTRYGKD